MAWSKSLWAACVLTLTIVAQGGRAQTALPQNSTDALRELDQLAGVIFTGEVVAVRRHEGVGGATGVVEIVFGVQDGIRGVTGSTYTVREWEGLWAGSERFRVGERYLMMLHKPGASGLSSPVGGMDGAIPLRGDWTTASGDRPIVDLRWVATRVVRQVVYRSVTAQPIVSHAKDISSMTEAPGGMGSPAPAPIDFASEHAGYTQVMEMLRGWEKK